MKKTRPILFLTFAFTLLAVTGNTTLWAQTEPTTAEGFYNRGVGYARSGDYDRAIADLTQAIRLNPNDAAAYYNKRDYNSAIADFESVLRINPNHPNAGANIERLRQRRGD